MFWHFIWFKWCKNVCAKCATFYWTWPCPLVVYHYVGISAMHNNQFVLVLQFQWCENHIKRNGQTIYPLDVTARWLSSSGCASAHRCSSKHRKQPKTLIHIYRTVFVRNVQCLPRHKCKCKYYDVVNHETQSDMFWFETNYMKIKQLHFGGCDGRFHIFKLNFELTDFGNCKPYIWEVIHIYK